jgi:hypothetical protein
MHLSIYLILLDRSSHVRTYVYVFLPPPYLRLYVPDGARPVRHQDGGLAGGREVLRDRQIEGMICLIYL